MVRYGPDGRNGENEAETERIMPHTLIFLIVWLVQILV